MTLGTFVDGSHLGLPYLVLNPGALALLMWYVPSHLSNHLLSHFFTMLILIAGITGNIGKQAASAGLQRGHRIRGLGRSPAKLDDELSAGLESFVVSDNYYDIAALERAVKGVDAVICAYAGLPELALDGQLLLLRAAERAGIKVSDSDHFLVKVRLP